MRSRWGAGMTALAVAAAGFGLGAVPASAAAPPSAGSVLPVKATPFGNGGAQFTDVTAAGATQGYAVEQQYQNDTFQTQLFRWRNGRWTTFANPPGDFYYPPAVAATGPNNLWVSESDDAYHWNGTAWQTYPLPFQNPDDHQSNDVAVAGTHAWVAANDSTSGVVYSWDGTAFTRTVLSDCGFSVNIEARTATDVYVTCTNGDGPGWGVWHFDGTAWTHLPAFDPGITVNQLAPDRAGTAWVSGHTYSPDTGEQVPVLLRWAAGAWTQVAAPVPTGVTDTSITAIVVDSHHRLWLAVRSDLPARSRYLRLDGTTWTTLYGPNRKNAIDVTANKLAVLPTTGGLLSVGRVQVFPSPAAPMGELLDGNGA